MVAAGLTAAQTDELNKKMSSSPLFVKYLLVDPPLWNLQRRKDQLIDTKKKLMLASS